MSEKSEKTVEAIDPAGEAKGAVSERLDRAREKFSGVVEGMEKKVKKIGEGAERTGQQVRESAEKATVAAKERYEVAREKVKQGYDSARKNLDHLGDDVNEYVRDNPGRSLLIAAAVGFLLGLLLRGGRRD